MLHVADNVVRGFEPGRLKNLSGIAILVIWLVAALQLLGRRLGYLILLLGSLLAAAIPVVHRTGKGVGGAIAASPGGYFFIWTLFALGVSGTFALILTLQGRCANLRRRQPRVVTESRIDALATPEQTQA
jgi:hypothetical protein